MFVEKIRKYAVAIFSQSCQFNIITTSFLTRSLMTIGRNYWDL